MALPDPGSRWYDHDTQMVWWVHMIARPPEHGGRAEITFAYCHGGQLGFELLSEADWDARMASGRYEPIVRD